MLGLWQTAISCCLMGIAVRIDKQVDDLRNRVASE